MTQNGFRLPPPPAVQGTPHLPPPLVNSTFPEYFLKFFIERHWHTPRVIGTFLNIGVSWAREGGTIRDAPAVAPVAEPSPAPLAHSCTSCGS